MLEENVIKLDKTSSFLSSGFTCDICGNIRGCPNWYASVGVLLVCDECKKDLKEIILEKRNK